ncbi:MAG TPA: hypothetical protein VMA36_05835 [Candidatus Limnocylindria bacterium]|nr:hypothetical protein [Candidatus Limnocylindria bacterium]
MRSAAHRSPRGWFAYLAVTLASALLAHALFDVVDGGFAALVTRPIHLLYALAVLAAFAAAAAELYHPRAAERRRRAALARAQVRRGGTSAILTCAGAQTLLAAATLLLDGAQLDPARLVVAACSALVAIVVGALAVRSVESAVLDVVALFVALAPERPPHHGSRRRDRAVVTHEASYTLFRPKRAPPAPPCSDIIMSLPRGRSRCLALLPPRRRRADSPSLSFSS